MTVPQSRLLIAICAAALLLTSCETANQRHASSTPPPQATAPALATVPAAAQPQAQPQPAPIDEANEATLPVDEKVKAKAEAELKAIHSDLPLVMNDYVAGYINYYSTRGEPVLQRALSRAGRYRELVRRIFAEEGVPQDLIY